MHTRVLNLQGLSVHCRLPSEGLLCYRGGICHLSVDTYRERVCNYIMQPCLFLWATRGIMRRYLNVWMTPFCSDMFQGFFLLSCHPPFPSNIHPLSVHRSLCDVNGKGSGSFHLKKEEITIWNRTMLASNSRRSILKNSFISHQLRILAQPAPMFLSETPLHASEVKLFLKQIL